MEATAKGRKEVFLKPGYIVNAKYEIIKVVKTTGSNICYTATDMFTGEKVFLKEFFSDRIMSREENGTIQCIHGKEVQYKSLMMDYEELHQFTMTLKDTNAVITPFEVFSCNGTCYAVEPILDIVTLESYLASHQGVIGWQKLKKSITPLITALRKMHNAGIYHRGISPENVMITPDERFLLSGFEIPAARTADSEIEAKLYFSYSAPEQYSSASWQGNWTDIYSLAALCYRSLTGFSPVEWRQRDKKRQLLTANSVDSTIPENVSNAIMTALSIDIRNRYRTIDEFWSSLLHGPGDTTIVMSAPKRDMQTLPQQAEKKNINTNLMIASVVLLTILVVFNVAAWLNKNEQFLLVESKSEPTSSESTSSQESEEPLKIVAPNLVGSSIERVLLDKIYTQFFEFDVKKEYSESVGVGVVIRQFPLPGVEVKEKGEMITLYISSGSERIAMPQVVDLPIEEASIILNSKDIPFVIKEEINNEKPTGTVVSASFEVDAIINRSYQSVELAVARQEN